MKIEITNFGRESSISAYKQPLEMKFGVVVFPGSNCDDDIFYVLDSILRQPVVKLWHKQSSLEQCDFIVLPGGFSYGDYLRSGAIAKFSPIMDSVIKHAHNGGYLWGICNGFQILTESGLLPGSLLHNDNQKFICRNTFIKSATSNSILTKSLGEDVLKIPIAHAEGRYFAQQNTIDTLKANDQILFRYCSEEGMESDKFNPNGSIDHIAGICNEQRNVFGMMPHPERAADAVLKNTDGSKIFQCMLEQLNVLEVEA